MTDKLYGMCPEEEELNRMAAADPEPCPVFGHDNTPVWHRADTKPWNAPIDEKMERDLFIESCLEGGIPVTRKNWTKFKDHRRQVLAKWEKIAQERMENV